MILPRAILHEAISCITWTREKLLEAKSFKVIAPLAQYLLRRYRLPTADKGEHRVTGQGKKLCHLIPRSYVADQISTGRYFYRLKAIKIFIWFYIELSRYATTSLTASRRVEAIIGATIIAGIQLRSLANGKCAYFDDWHQKRPLKLRLTWVYKNLIFIDFGARSTVRLMHIVGALARRPKSLLR
jgi:hypothetical protein